MADYIGVIQDAFITEVYRSSTPLGGFYYGRAKLIAGPMVQVGPGGSFHVWAAISVGQSVSCRSFVPADGDTMLEVRSLAGETIDAAHSVGDNAWETLTIGPLSGITAGIYIVRMVNFKSGVGFVDTRAYFDSIEVF